VLTRSTWSSLVTLIWFEHVSTWNEMCRFFRTNGRAPKLCARMYQGFGRGGPAVAEGTWTLSWSRKLEARLSKDPSYPNVCPDSYAWSQIEVHMRKAFLREYARTYEFAWLMNCQINVRIIVRCFLSFSLSLSLSFSHFLSLLCVHPPAVSVMRFVKLVCQICRCNSNIKSIKTCSGTAPYSILNDVLYLSHHGHAGGPSLAHRHYSRPTGAGFIHSGSTAWLRGASSPT